MKRANIIYLHHSTGNCIWNGGIPAWFENYNKENNTAITITEQAFPKKEPYGWANYPYDYYNIWVKNAGDRPYKDEPTLEMLTRDYDMVVFKHCYPVSNIKPDNGEPDIDSPEKSLQNYKLQYNALKKKLHEFPDTKFIVWTGAALTRAKTDEATAQRAAAFFDWVKNDWGAEHDNIFVWDFHALQTDGGLYFKDEYARSPEDSHPNEAFSKTAAPDLCRLIVDVLAADAR